MKRRILIGTACVLLGFGVGVAVAAISSGPGPTVPTGSFETAADCPEVDALLQRLSGHGTQYFIPKCPSLAEAKELVADSAPQPELVTACRETLERDPTHGGCQGVLDYAARYEQAFGPSTP